MGPLNQTVKDEVFQKIKEEALRVYLLAKESYHSAMEHSRSDDMKSEGKYDTRAIEAGYLASAKKNRMQELKLHYDALEKLDISPKKMISMGCLAKFQQGNGEKIFFITPGTSLKIKFNSMSVQTLSLDSPLIKESMGLGVGRTFTLETPQGDADYEVVEIL